MRSPSFTGINHVGVVTGDLDRAMRTWVERYGIGPWMVHTFDETNMSMVIDGDALPTAIRIASAFVGESFRIELIEPLHDDEGPYARSLREHGGAALGDAAAGGVGRVLDADFADAGGGEPLRVAYLDTVPQLGFITEIVKRPDDYRHPDPDGFYEGEAS
jgi:hypothetical protein